MHAFVISSARAVSALDKIIISDNHHSLIIAKRSLLKFSALDEVN
jgi:hypothetical protein